MDLRTPRADESRLGLESKPEKQPSRQDFEEMDIEEGWKRLVASRPLGPRILVYGAPLVAAGRHGGGFFCFRCFRAKRTGRHPAGRARVPTTQPSTPGSPHELGGWLDGPGDGRRRRIRYEVPINPLGALFNPGGIVFIRGRGWGVRGPPASRLP